MSDNQREIGNTTFNVNLAGVSDQGFNVTIDSEENYVVLFAGGYDAEANRPYYYNNIKEMYRIVTEVYGVAASNVYILYADGLNSGIDNSLGENSDMSFAASSNVLAATEANLANVFAEISVKADSNDHFLFYSFDHGAEAADGTDYLCAWNSLIKDTDFASYAATVTAGYQTWLMSQCYAWGMLEDMTVNGNIFLAGSAASDDTAHMAANDKTGMITAGFAAALEDALAAGISTTHTLYDCIFENNRFAVQDGQKMDGGNFAIFGSGTQEVRYGSCTLEFSSGDFSGSVVIDNAGFMVDIYNFSDNSYQVRAGDSDGKWNDPVTITPKTSGSGYIVSVSNGALDIFFAKSIAVWGGGYAARHGGISGSWSGTGEIVDLEGKNQITDIFEGSEDANILLLTDDENGDALFMDDLYSGNAQDARLVRIKEIRAGAGDDIIDLTSERLDYSDTGISVYGGNGDDVIWANKGENKLFGDSGNDRIVGGTGNDVIVGGLGDDTMHGGGGNDIFVLGRDWGNDTITQLADGNVTLWFATGVSGNWDAESMTFSFNGNQVTVSGISADKVTLKFGNDGSESYKDLSSAGAFATVTGGTIFTENETVYTNEILADTTISETVYINSYETANNVTIENGGVLYISSGGEATDTFINWNGQMNVCDGGIASGIQFNDYGNLYVEGSAADIICSSGYICVSNWHGSSAVISNTRISNGASLNVSSGGYAYETTIDEGGSITIETGGYAQDVAVNSYGSMNINSDGSASQVIIADSASAYVSSGAMLAGATLNSGGSMILSNGAIISETTVNGGGYLEIGSGVKASKTTLNSGSMSVAGGGYANKVTISSGGSIHIASGGTALYLDWTPCVGSVSFDSGASITYANTFSGVYLGSNGSLVANTGDLWYSAIYDKMYVMSQGWAYYNSTYDGAEVYVSRGGTMSGTRMSGGTIYVESSGIANDVVVSSGIMQIASGGTATDIRENGGAVNVLDGAEVTFASNTFSGTSLWSKATVHSNTTALDIHVAWNGTLQIFDGGVASGVNVTSSGTLIVENGGTASGIIENGGWVEVAEGANVEFASNTFGNTSLYYSATVHKNTVAENISVNDSGCLYVYSGGIATGIKENGGYVEVAEGANVEFIANTISGYIDNEASIHSSTTAENVTVNAGKLHIFDGGYANSTTIKGDEKPFWNEDYTSHYSEYINGEAVIYAGGTAENITVTKGGFLTVSSGGTATGIKEDGGYVEIAEGANVEFIANTISGYLSITEATVHENTRAENISLDNGTLYICSGGYANNAEVYESDRWINDDFRYVSGTIVVQSGGTAENTTVNKGGFLTVSSGGTATAIKENGGYVEVAEGANVEFVSATHSGWLDVKDMTIHSNNIVVNATIVNGNLHVCDGGVASSISTTSGGAVIVSSGGFVDSATVSRSWDMGKWKYVNGSIQVSAGGTATNTTVNSGGRMEIHSGGTATQILEDGGFVYVAEGANAEFVSNTLSGHFYETEMTLHSNTVMQSATIYSGSLHVCDGGVASGITVSGSGIMHVSSGGVVDNARLIAASSWDDERTYYSSAIAYVSNGGKVNDITITDFTALHVFDGGEANSATVHYSGTLHVSSGGTINDAIIHYDGNVLVAGGTANRTSVTESGTMKVYSGGTANDTIISGGSVFISKGAEANNTILSNNGSSGTYYNRSGYMYVSSGGSANGVTVNDGGYLHADYNGATVINVVENGGYVSDNGNIEFAANTFSGMTIKNYATVHNKTVAEDITLAGRMQIYSGGIANDILLTQGSLFISSGGTASIAFNPWQGNVYASDGADITYLERDAGIYLGSSTNYGSTTFLTGKYDSLSSWAFGLYIKANVYDGGSMDNATVYSSGCITVYGGSIDNTQVNSHGTLYISGGSANNTVISGTSGYSYAPGSAVMYVYDGTADNTIVNYGGQFRLQSGTANSNTINSSGRMFVSSGAVANNNTVNAVGSMFISSGGVASKSMVSGTMFVSSGGVANSNILSGGQFHVSNGGMANITTINSAGIMSVYQGGSADSTTINSGGAMYISSGAIATEIVENGGYVEVAEGANVTFASHTISGLTLRNSRTTVHANTVALDIHVSTYATMWIYSNGTAKNTTITSGDMTIHSGGTADSTAINQRGSMFISSGGMVDNTVISGDFASMNIHNGGEANNTLIDKGNMLIYAGGVANSTTVNRFGSMYISGSGIANGIAVSSGGNIYISSGGTVENIFIHSGANITFDNGTLRNAELDAKARLTLGQGTVDTFIVNSNAFLTASDTAMSNLHIKERGAAYISGGIVSDSEVENLAILQFCSGTTASNTIVRSGGHCYIGSGALHSGTLTIEEGATVFAFTGSELNFTIAGRSAGSDALVNNLSLISGNISYSITVSADQDSGIYRLADNVGEFTSDLKLFFGDETFENFSLGEVIESNGASFELSLENDSLLLEVFTPELQESAIFDEGDMLQGIEQFTIFEPMLAGNDDMNTNSSSELFKNGILA